jgi:HEAT repeat protein
VNPRDGSRSTVRLIPLVAMCASLLAVGTRGDDVAATQEQVGRLVAALSDAREHVRAAAAGKLGELGPAAVDAIPALLKAFRDESGEVECYAVDAVVKIGLQPSMIPDLMWLLHHNQSAAESVIEALIKIGVPAIPTALPLLDFKEELDGADEAQTWAQGAAIFSGIGKPAVPALIEAVKDPRKFWGATAALRDIGPDAGDAVPTLLKLAQDPAKRSRVVFTLVGIAPTQPDAVAFLVDIVREGEGSDRRNAIQALGKIGPPAAVAVPVLRERLRAHWDRPARVAYGGENYQETIEAVGNIGPAAKEAIPELQQALKHPYEYIRAAAASAIEKIEAVSGR